MVAVVAVVAAVALDNQSPSGAYYTVWYARDATRSEKLTGSCVSLIIATRSEFVTL